MFPKCARDLTLEEWWPVEIDPIVDCLEQLEVVKDKTFSWELEEEWEEAIESYTLMFAQLQVYCSSELNIKLNCTWKTHIILSPSSEDLAVDWECMLSRQEKVSITG